MFFRRMFIFIKRMCTKKLYLALLLTLMVLTAVYRLLPAEKQSADIKAGLYIQDSSDYADSLISLLENKNSLYSFYFADSEDALIKDVQSGYAQCGIYIPEGFFEDYIKGTVSHNKIIQYKIPSSSLAPAITETIFYSIFRVCSMDILTENATGIKDYKDQLCQNMNSYLESDNIFRLSDMTTGTFTFDELTYHIDIPVYEISLLLILFSGMLGLLVHMQDREKEIYAALGKGELFEIESATIAAALLPVCVVGCICSIIMYGFTYRIGVLIISTLSIYVFSLLLGIITKRSTIFVKVLPLIMLIAIALTFALNLM